KQCDAPDDSVDGVRQWLAHLSRSWLLILDNADDPKFDYANYFPSGNRGSILMTTRARFCSNYQTVGCEEMGFLGDADARELLLKTSGIESGHWEAHQTAAKLVIDLLGQHPLAIIQAGAFINRGYCNLDR